MTLNYLGERKEGTMTEEEFLELHARETAEEKRRNESTPKALQGVWIPILVSSATTILIQLLLRWLGLTQ